MADTKAYDEVICGMGTVVMPASHGIGHVNEVHVCTYEESHVMYGDKYLDHIAKCRQRKEGRTVTEEDGARMLICPYNPRHHFHYSVMDKHIQMCDGFYKEQMDKQQDPISMAESFRRYDIAVPIAHPDPEDVDNSSLYGDDDVDAPISGIRMEDVDGAVIVAKTRREFRKIQEQIAKKFVSRKLKEMRGNKNLSTDSSRASTPYSERFKTFNNLPEMTFQDKMKDVANFADRARQQLKTTDEKPKVG